MTRESFSDASVDSIGDEQEGVSLLGLIFSYKGREGRDRDLGMKHVSGG